MNFFDKNPVLHPWQKILRTKTDFWYKPREIFWRNNLKLLNFKKEDKVLEIGSGPGILLDRLGLQYQFWGTGIDASFKAIEVANRDKAWPKNKYLVGDAQKLPFTKESFDKIITFDVWEHLENQKKALKEMMRVLKPNGRFLLYTISNQQTGTWNWFLSKFGVDIYRQFDHRKDLFVNPKKLREQLKKEGAEIQKLIYFNAFFSLIADELIMLFLKFLGKTAGWEKHAKFAKMVLRSLTIISIVLTPLLTILDWPWTNFGYANSFLIIGQKKK